MAHAASIPQAAKDYWLLNIVQYELIQFTHLFLIWTPSHFGAFGSINNPQNSFVHSSPDKTIVNTMI